MLRAIAALVGQATVCLVFGFALGQLVPWSDIAVAQQRDPRCDGDKVCDRDCTLTSGACSGGCKTEQERCRDCGCFREQTSDFPACVCELSADAIIGGRE